ncbi:MAG: glycosyltransferase [Pirellulaceae bacterium]
MNFRRVHDPLISVVMPVYNADKYLVPAVASIIEQTSRDWELICVNDGSTDTSRQILEWFAEQDNRIRVVNQSNLGIVAALNGGCAIARAPLICRMDADDIAMPDRLERQAQTMRRQPNCTVVGGAIVEIDADGEPLNLSRLPSEHDAIVDNLLHRRTGHFHPTTMIRAEALEAVGGYRSKYQWVEDHDLWLRLAQRGSLTNLAEPVLCYRQHAGSVCWQRAAQQRQLMNDLLREAYAARGLETPASVISANDAPRSAAGPGKWARIAAKGGFARGCWKQLRNLHRSDAPWSYKARMTAEALLRLAIKRGRDWCVGRQMRDSDGGASSHILRRRSDVVVPTFPQWQLRAAELGHGVKPNGIERAA